MPDPPAAVDQYMRREVRFAPDRICCDDCEASLSSALMRHKPGCAFIARAVTAAGEEYAELQRRIEDLRAFEREYRARLRAYHQHHIDLLDGKDAPSER